jgi:hypothetical protein
MCSALPFTFQKGLSGPWIVMLEQRRAGMLQIPWRKGEGGKMTVRAIYSSDISLKHHRTPDAETRTRFSHLARRNSAGNSSQFAVIIACQLLCAIRSLLYYACQLLCAINYYNSTSHFLYDHTETPISPPPNRPNSRIGPFLAAPAFASICRQQVAAPRRAGCEGTP